MVIDEAAAIPLPLVKKLIGPYLVFMASTINGSVRCGAAAVSACVRALPPRVAQGLSGCDSHSTATPR